MWHWNKTEDMFGYWDVFELQGKKRTWFIGGSVSLEHYLPIFGYNIQLLSNSGIL